MKTYIIILLIINITISSKVSCLNFESDKSIVISLKKQNQKNISLNFRKHLQINSLEPYTMYRFSYSDRLNTDVFNSNNQNKYSLDQKNTFIATHITDKRLQIPFKLYLEDINLSEINLSENDAYYEDIFYANDLAINIAVDNNLKIENNDYTSKIDFNIYDIKTNEKISTFVINIYFETHPYLFQFDRNVINSANFYIIEKNINNNIPFCLKVFNDIEKIPFIINNKLYKSEYCSQKTGEIKLFIKVDKKDLLTPSENINIQLENINTTD